MIRSLLEALKAMYIGAGLILLSSSLGWCWEWLDAPPFRYIFAEAGRLIGRLCLFLSIVTVSGAYAADDVSLKRQVEMLSQRVGELERRLDAIESPEIKAAIQQAVPPTNPGDSADGSNWSRLKIGFTYSDVRELLGEPLKIKPGDVELWYYSDQGADGPHVKFVFRLLNNWKAP